MTGLHFWATRYSVSTVGLDEARIRQYIRDQEKLESGQRDLDLKQPTGPSGAFSTCTARSGGPS